MTPYIILEPVVSSLGRHDANRLRLATAVSSVISFVLICPTPVVLAATGPHEVSPKTALKAGQPHSLILLVLAFFYMGSLADREVPQAASKRNASDCRARAWGPLILPLAL